MTTHTINGDQVNLADYTSQRLSDGTMTWVHRDLSHRIVLVRKRDFQRIKGIRRKAAGKPSYRQRQASAKAAARKRSVRVVA
jgi:hypothetical protein